MSNRRSDSLITNRNTSHLVCYPDTAAATSSQDCDTLYITPFDMISSIWTSSIPHSTEPYQKNKKL